MLPVGELTRDSAANAMANAAVTPPPGMVALKDDFVLTQSND
jgi:hypothetical protein